MNTNQERTPGVGAVRWGQLLRLARQVAGLSLTEVAARSGLSKGYLSKLESAHPSAANPSRATLAALLRALPSTLPLIQQLDPDNAPPTAAFLLPQEAQQKAPDTSPESLTESAPQALPGSWREWEILLAVRILENSGMGPPTTAVIARACGIETVEKQMLTRLEQEELLQRIPPSRPGEAIRYTQGSKLLEQSDMHGLAGFFAKAAIGLLLKIGHLEHE